MELLEMPTRVEQLFEVDNLGALDATTSEDTSAIKRKDAALLRQITETLDKQLLSMLSCRTGREFEEKRKRIWSRYFRARRALSDTIDLLIPKNVIELVRFATSERISDDLKQSREVLFNAQIAEQMEFSSWLLGKIQFFGREVAKANDPRDRDADSRLHEDFVLFTSWAQFHYDCVLASMKFELEIPEEIQDPIRDGLRAWVNACAIVEEALVLRIGDGAEKSVEFFEGHWDEEDQHLLDSSMRDLDAKCCSDL